MNKVGHYPITRSLAYVSLVVRDLQAAIDEAQEINGLHLVERSADTAYLTSGGQMFELLLRSGPVSGLQRIGLEATNERSFHLLKGRLQSGNILFDELSDPYPGISNVVRFHGPSGHVFELANNSNQSERLFYGAPGVRPRRLGHALLKVEDLQPIEDFLIQYLNFRVSDRALNGEIVWLRCSEIHHSINLIKGAPGLHHYAWEVDDWSEFKRIGDVLRGHGRQFVWGPGRHGPGNNLFTYHADLTGILVEYFTDILRVEREENYKWKDWSDIPEWNNIWGPMPPANFRDYGVQLV
jgi:catechol 2,3-dioxygenase-like lactoylglutathione lyase family enzyme